MIKHISIFALLLSAAFSAVGADTYYYVAANVSCTMTHSYTGIGKMSFEAKNSTSDGYYDSGHAENSFTKIQFPNGFTLTAEDEGGYRFDGWYSHKDGWAVLADATVTSADNSISKEKTLTDDAVDLAGKWTRRDIPVVFAKYVKVWTITTHVSPASVGTVTGGGTVDEGGSVTLTATPNKGYEFSKWSDGNTTNPRTINGIVTNATYTAVFTKKVNAITSGPTIENWTYGDTPKSPSAQAKYNSTEMAYTYYNSSKQSLGSSPPTNAGTYYITATSPSSDEYVSATSDYVQFSILKKTINTDNISFSNKSVIYTGGAQAVTASNVPSGVTVTYSSNSRTAVGEQTATAKFAATDSANCEVTKASKTAKLTITEATITGVTLKSTSVTYDGQSHQPQVESVTANGKTFATSGTGWTVTYLRNSVETSDFKNAGMITVRVTGTGNLTGSSTASFTIGTKEILMDEVVFDDLTVTYDGTEKTIKASNVPSGVTATYSSNTRTTVGEQQAQVTFKPNDKNHTVSLNQKSATLKIEAATITAVTLNGISATYDGESHKPTVSWVTANNKTFSNSTTGWDVTYLRGGAATGDFISPGTITVTATGNSNLKGSKSATFTINKATIESVTLSTGSATYDGQPHKPVVSSVTANGKSFSSASAGWTVAYTRDGAATTDFTKAGAITVTVTGKTGLSGSASATFTIARKTISTTEVGFSDKSVTYDGTAKSITASGVPEGVTVTYSNNSRTDAGSQTATVNFEPTDKENCTVSPTSKTATLTVNPATISSISLSATSATYDGQPHQPTVVSVTANNKTFTDAAIGWDVVYDKTDFTSVGNIKVTANGNKNLTGSANATFEIKSKSITVTFDPNGGNEPSPMSKTVQYPGTYGPLATCTRRGYDFKGWWTAKEGGTQITETTSVESTASQTLFAHWEAKHYKLTVDANGGEYEGHKGSWDLQEPLIYGETNLNQIAVAIKNDDSPLLGYKIGSTMVFDSQGRCVKGALGEYWTADYPDGTYCHDGHLVVTAEWDDPREHYQVIVTASPEEAGTVSPAGTNTFVEGSNVVLTATAKAGYSFLHWTKNGAEVSTDKEYPITVNANAEYIAVFTGKVVKVNFLDVSEGNPPQVRYVSFGSEFGSLPTVVSQTKDFKGWYTGLFGSGDKITPETKMTSLSELNLFADWKEIEEYTVTFDDPKGGNEPIPGKRTKDKPIGNAAKGTENWKRDGYWRDNSSDWDPPLTTLVTSNMTVNAKWTSIADVLDCTNLTFNVSAGPNWKVCTSEHVVGDSCMQLESNTGNDHLSVRIPEAGTLSFNWKVSAGTLCVSTNNDSSVRVLNGSAEKWNAGEKEIIEISGPCDLTFYGYSIASTECLVDNVSWVPKGEETRCTLTVESDGNGEVGKSPDDDDYAAGTGVTISATPSDGYAFERWSDGSAVNPRQIVVTSNVTYVAMFAVLPPDEYTLVVLSTGHGAVAKNPNQAKYEEGTSVTITATPDAGYSFGKWSDGSAVNPRKITVTSNAVYSASFTNCVYEITLNANGGSGGPTSVTATYGEALPTLGSLPSREGFALTGYFDAVSGGVKYYNADGTGARNWDKTSDTEFFAQWEQNMGDVSAALDCNNLMFKATGGWTILEEPDFAYTKEGGNDFYLKTFSADSGESGLSATVTVPGQLTFYWRAQGDGLDTTDFSVFVNGDERPIASQEDSDSGWVKETITVAAAAAPATIRFTCEQVGSFCAIDFVTWTPDGGGEPTPGTQVEITAAGVANGVFSLTIPTATGTDYGVWTNADLTIDSWGLMGDPRPGDGNPWKVEWTILPGFPQLFFRAHKVEYK